MNDILKNILNENNSDEINATLDAFIDPVIVFDNLGIITKANKAARDVLQFNPTELTNDELNKRAVSCFLSCNMDKKNSILVKVLKGEIIKEAPYSYRDSHGNIKSYTCSGSPFRSLNTIAGALLVWHNITENKEKELQLEISNINFKTHITEITKKQKVSDKQIKNDKEKMSIQDSQIMVSNKLLEIIFSNTHFLIAYLAADFTFIQVNDAYARAFSQSPPFFIGKNHFDLFPRKELKAIFKNVVNTGMSFTTYAEPFFHSNKPDPGTTYWDWSLKPIKNNNEVEGIILVLIDVTRRKKAEEDLFNAKRLSDLGTLAATVAHELRNPLSVIQAAIYNIKRKRQNKEIDKHIESINAKVKESDQIINNLLNYSKLKLPKRIKIPIYDFLNQLLNDIRSKKVKDSVTFKRNLEVLKETIVPIDPVQIREVLNNIINNAYQSLSRENGRIEIIGSLSKNSQLHLHIIDNGDGIEEQDLDKIFNPFFTKRSKGTGLGLTICKELIKLHNGTIEIQSQKGDGTTVKISLPLKIIE